MFTGIVETIGAVSALESNPDTGTTLTISSADAILGDVNLGDSISVNGTCLTITTFTPSTFTVGVAPETLRRTNLGSLQVGASVNLERAVSASTRMGGHFVQGHVDTTAAIAEIRPDGEAVVFRFEPREKKVLRYVVEKGYVCIDGASLTVTAVDDAQGWWEVMLVAYTQGKVVTAAKKVGEEVNVEVDLVGKYVEKSVEGYFEEKRGGEEGLGAGGLERLVERIVDRRLGNRTNA
ncbi:MAG: Riboflavin synthase alpha chain [Vezdaea aestivalis]|nr:MAG: Riboflavin synthase alpha chain [Vezdaea aestivalis]